MRSQVVAAMVFNGHTEQYINTLDEELFSEIQVMFADGMLGNKGVFDALAPLTAGIFNYLRAQGSPSYKPEQIFPWIHEYSVNPDLELPKEDKVNESLLTFMTQAHGFNMERFKKKDG